MKYKIPKFSGLCLVSSKMQNLLPSLWSLEALLGLFDLLRLKLKMKNRHLFAKKFVWYIVPLFKIMNQNLNFFLG
jgi:hypothetical protein